MPIKYKYGLGILVSLVLVSCSRHNQTNLTELESKPTSEVASQASPRTLLNQESSTATVSAQEVLEDLNQVEAEFDSLLLEIDSELLTE